MRERTGGEILGVECYFTLYSVRDAKCIMTLIELQKELDRVTYKPNARFEASNSWDSFMYRVTLFMDVPEVNDPSITTTIQCSIAIEPETIDRAYEGFLFKTIVARLIKQMEMHEMDEWFKVDGKHVRDPHPKGKE